MIKTVDAIDLNADVGEMAPELDDAILQVVSSVNIACGGHAGDQHSMRRVASRAAERGIRIGAHPSFVDRDGFGRVHQQVAPGVLREQIREQILALAACSPSGVQYVKPHGALYHAAGSDPVIAQALLEAVGQAAEQIGPLSVMGQHTALYVQMAESPVITEGFADRVYRSDGTLLPRSEPSAVLDDHDAVLEQVVGLTRGSVRTHDGQIISVRADSVCVHSDTPGAAALAHLIHRHLADSGIAVRS